MHFATLRACHFITILLCSSILLQSANGENTDPVVGTFSDGVVNVVWNTAPGSTYSGEIRLGKTSYPFTAKSDGERTFSGNFTSGGTSFVFVASIVTDTLWFTTGNKTYQLERQPGGNAAPVSASQTGGTSGSGKPGDTEPPGRTPSGAIRVNRQTIHDAQAQLDAATILVPDGWNIDAKVLWRMHPTTPACFSTQISNPAGSESLWLYPQGLFVDQVRETIARYGGNVNDPKFADGQHYFGSEIRPETDPSSYIQQVIVPTFRPDLAQAQVVDTQPAPKVAEAVMGASRNMPNATARSACVRYTYSLASRRVDEDFYCTIIQMPDPTGPVYWKTLCRSYRADHGKLEAAMPLYLTIDTSARLNPSWFAVVCNVCDSIDRIIHGQIVATQTQTTIVAQASREISDMQRQLYENQRKSQAESFNKWDEVIRGVQTVKDPYQEFPIQVPANFKKVFSDSNGSLILSDDPHLTPNILGGNWQEDVPVD